jgi:glutamate formiminotransferase/formiminotetrahydrofolate cyclodeaminase
VLQVVEAICKEACQNGVHLHHGEVVGLIPQEALTETAIQALKLEGFQAEQILEERLKAIVSRPEPSFLDALAAGTPAPGGGSAAAYAGAMSAALIAMVAHLTIGKKKYAEAEAQVKEILAQAERLRAELTETIQKDADAFEEVIAAFKIPKDTAEQNTARQDTIEQATRHAAEVPLSVARHAVTLMALAERLAALGNLNAITDAGSAAAMARASLTSAAYNVRINLLNLNDKSFIDKSSEQLASLEEKANQLEKQVQKTMATRGKISF